MQTKLDKSRNNQSWETGFLRQLYLGLEVLSLQGNRVSYSMRLWASVRLGDKVTSLP